jgi:hypothetical protein
MSFYQDDTLGKLLTWSLAYVLWYAKRPIIVGVVSPPSNTCFWIPYLNVASKHLCVQLFSCVSYKFRNINKVLRTKNPQFVKAVTTNYFILDLAVSESCFMHATFRELDLLVVFSREVSNTLDDPLVRFSSDFKRLFFSSQFCYFV